MSDIEPFDTLSEADPDTERRLGAFPNPSLAECPVVPLGYDGNLLIFGMPEGEIRREIAGRIGSLLKTDVFCCVAGQAFLGYWRDKDDKFQRELAAVWFTRQCREAGKWDSRRVSRSLGVWPDGPINIVLHKGDEVLRYSPDGEVERVSIIDALRVRTGPLYKLFPPAVAPGDPSSIADGRWLRQAFDMWRFEDIGPPGPEGDPGLNGADIVAGWIMSALLGAVVPFRGHLLIRAMAGSGKTTMMTLVDAALSALSGGLINSFSEAGFRSDIAGMARPIVLDEVEQSTGDQGPGPVEQVMTHLRLMATGAGSNRKQGSQDGGTVTQSAVGSVIMAAILPPPLDSALASRVADVKLLPLNGSDLSEADRKIMNRSTDPQIIAATARAMALAPQLLARALAGAWRYREDVAAVKQALVDAEESPRTADLVAMLAAGRRLLMFDDPLTPEEAQAEVAFWRPLLVQREASETVSNPGADALGHLLAWDSGLHKGDRRASIGELVQIHLSGEKLYEAELKALGLRIHDGPGKDAREGPWLIVANHHPGLERIFGRTRWRDWKASLDYLAAMGPDHAGWATKPLHFGLGVKARGVAIPLTPWLEKPHRSRVGAAGSVPGGVPSGVPGDDHDF